VAVKPESGLELDGGLIAGLPGAAGCGMRSWYLAAAAGLRAGADLGGVYLAAVEREGQRRGQILAAVGVGPGLVMAGMTIQACRVSG
jgi:hypothetical protein